MPVSAKFTLSKPTLTTNLRGLWRTMRPQQWVKNVLIYAALVFDGKLFDGPPFLRATAMVVCFCLAASSVYLMNDLVDIEKDRQHPRKRLRALASGALSPRVALVAAVLLAGASLALAFWLTPLAGAVLVGYLLLNVAYSFYLKNIVLIDVMALATNYLLRVVAGVVVVGVANFSPWLYVCITLLALFLGFGKRRHEVATLGEAAASHRASLSGYNLPLLDQIIGVVTTSTLVAYTFYTFEAQTALVADDRLLLTVPLVFYFIARYLYLIHVQGEGGAPDELLLRDRPLLLDAVLWALLVVALIYWIG